MDGTMQAGLPEKRDLGSLMRDQIDQSIGANGFEVIRDAVKHTAPAQRPFAALSFFNDTVFADLDGSEISGDVIGPTFPAGFTLFGRFTSVTIATGGIIAYYAKPVQ